MYSTYMGDLGIIWDPETYTSYTNIDLQVIEFIKDESGLPSSTCLTHGQHQGKVSFLVYMI